ncbi:hypothetical protein PABG_12082 [Paracoccidioides brasiliensis Pb03]|nr:hypothetical protein PABG_12082 [Paracoccidioides brasiliensis Pb03]
MRPGDGRAGRRLVTGNAGDRLTSVAQHTHCIQEPCGGTRDLLIVVIHACPSPNAWLSRPEPKVEMNIDGATPRSIYCPRPVVSSPLYLAHSVARVAMAGEGLVPPRLSAHGERGVEALVLSGTWEGWWAAG